MKAPTKKPPKRSERATQLDLFQTSDVRDTYRNQDPASVIATAITRVFADAPPIGRHRSQVEAMLRDEIASIKQSLINEIRTPLCD